MVSLNTYRSQVSLNTGRKPNVALNNDLGQAIGNVGVGVLDLDARVLRRKNFEADAAYRRMQQDLEATAFERQQNMPEGGGGFHDNFMVNDFAPAYDQFMASISGDRRVSERYALERPINEGAWSLTAARAEHGEMIRYQTHENDLYQNQLMQRIALDPAQYEAYLAEGEDFIASMSVSPAEASRLRDAWAQSAMGSLANTRLQADPAALLRDLGGSVEDLTPEMRAFVTQQAVMMVLSSDQGGGAAAGAPADEYIGRYRLRLEDGARLAEAAGDADFPTNGTPDEQRAYMASNAVGEAYSKAYLSELLTKHSGDPTVAAFEYLAGEEATEAWLAADRSWTGVPRDLKTRVESITAATTPSGVTPSGVSLSFGSGRTNEFHPATRADLAGVPPRLLNMAQTAFAAAGLDNINITDGVRTRAENTAVGGATGSRHIAENGGDAIDIKLPEGMTTAEKVNLIRQLSAAGVGGIGVYRTQIHIDLGARRSWGPSYSAGENLSGIPAWARGVIGEHLAGSISATPRAYVADEFSTMNEGTRQTAMAEARRLVAATARENAVPISDQRALFTQQTDDVIANIYNTGQGADTIDMDQAREILTVSGRIKLDEDIFVAQQVYAATDGISGMTEAQLEALLTQTRPETTGDTFGDVGDRIATEIAAEVEEVLLRHPDVADAAAVGRADAEWQEAVEAVVVLRHGAAAGAAEAEATMKTTAPKEVTG